MSIAEILVPLNGTTQDAVVAAAAIRAAKPFNAHVTAAFVHPDPAEAIPLVGMPLTGEAVQAIISGQTKFATDSAKAARATFLTVCHDEGAALVGAPERRDAVTCEFREYAGHAPNVVAELASLSDFVVLDKSIGSPEAYDTILDVLLKAQRPVLLCAQAPETLFEHVVIGWDGGPCAAHAMFAAIPYLAHARSVEVVTVDRGQCADLQDVKTYLKLHGISCTTRSLHTDHRPIHETLLQRVEASHADTLVLGGYSHSRVRETLFGGVTLEMLYHARVPLFLMH